MSRTHFYGIVQVLVLAIISPFAFGQGKSEHSSTPEYTITKRLISTEDGLASHEVFCGLQDKAGFMWFGTRNGLNRYDGKNCLLFTHQRNHLQDNKIVQLAQDNADNLFIEYGGTGFQRTTNGRVDVMNAVTQDVKTLTAAFPKLPFREQDVYWVANDGTDEVSFLTAHPFRLWKYSPAHSFRLRYQFNDWTDKADSYPFVDYRETGALCLFAKGKALVKFFNQSAQYLVSADTVITFKQKDALRSLPVGFDNQNDLLITYNTSANATGFDVGAITHTGHSIFPADTRQYHADGIKGRYWYQVACSADGASGILDIPTDGLYLWNENTFLKVISSEEIKNFDNLFLYKLFPDNFGNLWLCTSLGVLQLKIEKNRFRPYFTTKQQLVETNNQARGIYADGNRVVANIWTHIFQQRGEKVQNVANEQYNYALVRHNGSLYIGGYDLFNYDLNKNSTTQFRDNRRDEIWSMFSVNDSVLLLGRTNGFSVFNSNTRKFYSPHYTPKNVPDAKFVYRFFKDGSGMIWAVAENGLYKITYTAGSQWSVTNDRSALIARLSLLDAYADKDGIFWLATNGEGLYRWDRKANVFQQFNIASGLPSDVLYRIEPDKYNNLWISSDYGLIRFNKTTFAVNTYTTADGITNNEFNRTSSFKAADGKLYFGGLDGIIAFDPRDFATDALALNVPLRVIAFNQFVGSQNQLVNMTRELLTDQQITLAPSDRFFTLEFQLLDFAKGDHYAYRIVGLDKDWNYITENSIRISGLPYGKFTLHIKAQNREGAWSKSELIIPVMVLKPFYLKWWFIGLMTLMLVITIYWIVRWRTRQLAEETIRLEQTVGERTLQLKQSLAEQAGLLSEKDILMREIHHRVKNNLQVISGLLELQSKAVADEAAKDALMEGRNRVRSIALIHQNLYQVENLSSIELRQFVSDLCRQVESVYKKQAVIGLNIEVPVLYLDIDSAVPLGLIMNELLTNSFKYAFNDGAPGRIDIEISIVSEGRYELTYSDNGPGLPKDFDLAHATTMGMQLIYDLSRQIGGKVNYVYKNGATFIINFTNRSLRKKED
ncbi:histidine kinase dimerization/phosphoacceptor domain -containing protein [Mucilaginibacter ginsenosidivorans]|uniref:Histidine kinase domain-containing protein n=1 Tax=Mucilaginibacter ginsenosidivorans TaxID=398053 RepID=A0A5B8UXJ1_9SPHI|nr:histidine kinase dimerization/phosphoacceptor domain -containing protein [Mucilaginibacter ginsenosidivorans]QEC63877.1 hypothetical protein FRZ54_15275 [Mucilaginibacter ginsenosidivorans]